MQDQQLCLTTSAKAIRDGKLTPCELVEQCLEKIDRYEDKVRAWVLIDREGARAEAKRLTAELKNGISRGPLHGIPIGIKDIIDVCGWPTAAGSKRWANRIAEDDAVVVKNLRQAGAIILGKTVTTAYASFDPSITRNPWDLSKTPGGSSSGSAAAVACGMCFGALGTQTGGSITRPASFCGVCSIKPTYGVISVEGVLPLAPSLDHVGVMAGCVEDLAILFEAMRTTSNSTSRLAATGERPALPFMLRLVGLFDEMASPEMLALMDNMEGALRSARPKQVQPPVEFSDVLRHHRTIMAVEASQFHGQRMQRHPEDYPPCITQLIEEGLAAPEVDYQAALQCRHRLANEMNTMLTDSFAFTPATLGSAPDLATTGNPAFNSPWSFTGQPTVSFPMGLSSDGLPMSVQLIGRHGSESELLAAASWCEKVIGFQIRALDQ